MNRSGIKYLTTALLIILLASAALASDTLLRTYQGTLTAPSQEEWQNMLETRTEKHSCMSKSFDRQEQLKYTMIGGYDQPTTAQLKFDVLYYEINLDLDLNGQTIDGYVESKVKITYDNVSIIEYNLYDGLSVSAVLLNGSPVANYNQSNDILTINLGQTYNTNDQITLKVEYNGHPIDYPDGMSFYNYGGNMVAFTKCEPWGARNWWPCKDYPFDKPDSVDIIITHPSQHTLASNGTLVSTTNNGNGTITTHWHERYPIATYLVQIGCAVYDLYTSQWQYQPGQYMPVYNYSYDGIPTGSTYFSLFYMLNYTIPSLEALSYYFSLYPFVEEKYGHNHFGWGGAMEHQTLTSISESFNTEYVIAHELGHQWAGDLVTCYDFHHVWLNEGFASYSEALYFKYHYGNNYYRSWLNSQKHLDAGTPYVEDVINDDIFDNTTVYDKASWVVYMLHNVLGDSLFIEAVDNYFNHPALKFGAAYTSDLEAAFEEIYGSDLSWFFNAWVYNPGNPNYVYSFSSEVNTIEGGYDTYILLSQTQSGSIFPMPVDIRIFGNSYDTAFTVFNSQRGQLWLLNTPVAADSVWVDRDEKILRTVSYSPEFQMSILADKEVDTAYIGVPYSAEYSVIAGIPPYTWSKISGQFPYGLVFTSGNPATLAGTPTWNSTFVFTLEVLDSDSPPNADTITMTVAVLEGVAPDVPTLLAPPNGEIIADDTPAFSWSSTAGSGGNYTLQYADNYQFSTNVTTITSLTGTSYEPLVPIAEGLWYWRVQAYSDVGTPSGYQLTPFNFTYSIGGGMRGDANSDGKINVSDAVYIINYVFIGGPAPDPLQSGDVNCDDSVNVSDAVYIINYVFIGGPEPCSY